MDTIGYKGPRLGYIACWGALLLAGCGQQGPMQLHVTGEVTWRGQPVPAGMVTFTPDVRQGNTGHQGLAVIHNGQFSTRAKGGRGPGSGPHVIAVLGYDGKQPTDESPLGQMLFEQYQFTHTLPEAQSSFDISVPN